MKTSFGIRFPLFGAMLIAGLGFISEVRAAGKCGGDSARYHIMPKVIGRPNEIFKTPFTLPCDSMLVPAGQTTTIHAATMINFGTNPSLASRIVVKGTLLVEGKPENPVYFSASVKQSDFGYVPGTQVWDGLQVESEATVKFKHARIFNAPTALVVFSKNVTFEDCYLQGASGIILLDTNLLLNTQGHTIDILDLRKGLKSSPLSIANSAGTKGKSDTAEKKSGIKKGLIYTAGGVGIAAAAGIALFALNGNSKANPPPIINTNSLDADPELPTAVPLKP